MVCMFERMCVCMYMHIYIKVVHCENQWIIFVFIIPPGEGGHIFICWSCQDRCFSLVCFMILVVHYVCLMKWYLDWDRFYAFQNIVLSGSDGYAVKTILWRHMVKSKSRYVSVPGTINMKSMVYCDCLMLLPSISYSF